MFSPCFECYNRYGKQYTKECDTACEYAMITNIFKTILTHYEKCEYCKFYTVCVVGNCINYDKYVLDFEKIKTDFYKNSGQA